VDDARILADQFGNGLVAEDFLSLPKFRAYAKLTTEGNPLTPFVMQTAIVTTPDNKDIKEYIIQQTHKLYANKQSEASAESKHPKQKSTVVKHIQKQAPISQTTTKPTTKKPISTKESIPQKTIGNNEKKKKEKKENDSIPKVNAENGKISLHESICYLGRIVMVIQYGVFVQVEDTI